MYKHFFTFTILSIVLISFQNLCSNQNIAFAKSFSQEPAPQSPGVDMIIILDQSGSMKGIGGPATDPDNRRIETAKYLIDYLSFDNKYVNPSRVNRVSVIGFGGEDPELILGLTSLKDDVSIKEAKHKIVAKNMGNTNFIDPLKMVRDIFPSNTDKEVENGTRRRLLVLLTDGGPEDDRRLLDSEYMKEIRKYYSENLPKEIFPMYVVAIDQSNRYWPTIASFWKEIAVQAEKVNNINEVNKFVGTWICSFLSSDGSTTECQLQKLGNHFIQPYAELATFSFFKYDEGDTITLKRADGSVVNPGSQENCVGDGGSADSDIVNHVCTRRDEMITMSNPEAGCWLSERIGKGEVDVITQVKFNNLHLIQPHGAHLLPLPMNFVFELREKDGTTLIGEDPNFPVTLQGELLSLDGKTQSITIDHQKDANGNPISGVYVSTNIPELIAGEHKLIIKGFTSPKDISRFHCSSPTEPVRVFENEYLIPVVAPAIKVLQPAQPFLEYFPVQNFVVAFIDEKGQPIPVPQNIPWKLELNARTPSGADLVLPTPVIKEDGYYHIDQSLVFSESGDYVLTAKLLGFQGNELLSTNTEFNSIINLKVVQPGKNFPAYSPLDKVKVELHDTENQPVDVNQSFPLRIEAKLYWPGDSDRYEAVSLDSVAKNLEVNDEEGEENSGAVLPINEYSGDVKWTLTDEGEYTFRIVGYVAIAPGDEREAFRYESKIRVSGALPYFQIIAPQRGKSREENQYPLHILGGFLPWRDPMRFRVEVWRDDIQVAPQDAFSGDLNNIVELRVIDYSGREVIPFTPMKLSKDGRTLEYVTENLTQEGKFKAYFKFHGEIIGDLKTEGAWPDTTIEFERRDPIEAIWFRWFVRVVIILILLAIAIFLLLDYVILTKAKGRLVAERGQGLAREEIWSCSLGRDGAHWIWLWGNSLSRLNLKSILITGKDDGKSSKSRGKSSMPYTNTPGAVARVGIEIIVKDTKGQIIINKRHLYTSGPESQGILCSQSDTDGQKYTIRLEN